MFMVPFSILYSFSGSSNRKKKNGFLLSYLPAIRFFFFFASKTMTKHSDSSVSAKPCVLFWCFCKLYLYLIVKVHFLL